MDTEKTQTVGEKLRQARERKGATISDVASEIMVPQHYLIAIEEDRYSALPGQTYAVGFVRNYSRYLCLPPTDIVAQLKSEVSFPKTLDTVEIASGFVPAAKRNVLPSAAAMLSGLCVAAGVYALWFTVSATNPSAALPAAIPEVVLATSPAETQIVKAEMASIAPAMAHSFVQSSIVERVEAALPAAPNPIEEESIVAPVSEAQVSDVNKADVTQIAMASVTAQRAQSVNIHVAEESWVEVRSDGEVFYSGLKQAGDVLNIPADRAATAQLTTGNAGGIWVSVGDWTSRTLGETGKVRRNIALAPDQLRERFAAADRS